MARKLSNTAVSFHTPAFCLFARLLPHFFFVFISLPQSAVNVEAIFDFVCSFARSSPCPIPSAYLFIFSCISLSAQYSSRCLPAFHSPAHRFFGWHRAARVLHASDDARVSAGRPRWSPLVEFGSCEINLTGGTHSPFVGSRFAFSTPIDPFFCVFFRTELFCVAVDPCYCCHANSALTDCVRRGQARPRSARAAQSETNGNRNLA